MDEAQQTATRNACSSSLYLYRPEALASTASEVKASDMHAIGNFLFEKVRLDFRLLFLLTGTWSAARGPWGFSGKRQLQATLARPPGFLVGGMQECRMANDNDRRHNVPYGSSHASFGSRLRPLHYSGV